MSEYHDEHWMAQALSAALRGLGNTAPNPSVGAILVRDDELLGEGHTQPAGSDHAEVQAIKNARAGGHDVAGATMYTTLEPCCHHGRTPPCTDAILDAGIHRVVVGVVDPFPAMQGRSLELLREAGVDVTLGVLEEPASRMVRGFTRSVIHGLPEVSLKAAISLDGHIATGDGESKWITSPQARAHGHRLRAGHDAMLVGIGTVLADDPRLTCRVEGGTDPVPVVLDSQLRIPADARLFQSSRQALVFCAPDAPERDLPGQVVRVARTGSGLDIEAVLRWLAKTGHHRVLVEGGAGVHRTFLDSCMVDTLYVYLAGLVIPGGRPWVGGPPLGALGDATRFGAPELEAFGPDVLLRYRLQHQIDEED